MIGRLFGDDSEGVGKKFGLLKQENSTATASKLENKNSPRITRMTRIFCVLYSSLTGTKALASSCYTNKIS